MKHFEKKFTYAGAKGSKPPPPKPPTLKPPRIGQFKIGASYQVSESVDLLSDGPIDGLCNRFGARLSDNDLLQGIYLNDVPIEESAVPNKQQVSDAVYEASQDRMIDLIQDWEKQASKNYLNPRQQETRHVKTTTTTYESGGKNSSVTYDSYILNKNLLSAANFSWSNSKPISYIVKYRLNNLYKGSLKHYVDVNWEKYADQRFTEILDLPKQKSSKFFDESSVIRFKHNNSIKSSIRMEYSPSYARIDTELLRGWNYFYRSDDANIICSYPNYDNAVCSFRYQENGSDVQTNSICRRGVNQLTDIYENRFDNVFEWEYLLKKLKSNGINQPIEGQAVDYSFFLNAIRTKWGFHNDFVNTIKGNTIDKNLVHPFIVFTITDEMDGFDLSQRNDFVDLNGSVLDREFDFVLPNEYYQEVNWFNREKRVLNMLIPSLDPINGEWDGTVKGFFLHFPEIELKDKTGKLYKQSLNADSIIEVDGTIKSIGIKKKEFEFYEKTTGLGVFRTIKSAASSLTKYNFSNVLAEFRNGEGATKQSPLNYFKNIYLDRAIQKRLIGPFNTSEGRRQQALQNYDKNTVYKTFSGGIKQRSLWWRDLEDPGANTPADNAMPSMEINSDTGEEEWLVAKSEGSRDVRDYYDNFDGGYKSKNFSDWNSFREEYNERAQPITHVIYNPNVTSCFFTLNIEGLWDTLHRDRTERESQWVGSKIPAIVNIRVEVGYIDPEEGSTKGKFVKSYDRFFRIVSLIEGGAGLDIGNPDNLGALADLEYVKEIYPDSPETLEGSFEGAVGAPFELPSATYSEDYGYEQVYRDRYIRVTKLSTEGNSTLINKTLNIAKVTEIIPTVVNYPFSAVCGMKLDSRSYGQIPQRSYDLRLKKIKIPSNYNPLNRDGTDKRFWDSAEELKQAGNSEATRVYDGDWDGTFKIGWSDNPAWILYDLLTNDRVGLGQYLKDENVNKWQLYKIARWCDAVDEQGYFVGVADNVLIDNKEKGGREPRYSCSVLFQRGIKIFDAINAIASNFRGLVYFSDSVVSFADDRAKTPVMLFNNSNVVDGIFNYSNLVRSEQYNAIEVTYIDSRDNFTAKLEYVENEQDIIERGLFKTTTDAFGVTTQAQARRFGEHLLYQSTRENESISFSTGLEGIICRPGDLIIVEDDLKTLSNNFGKVLDVNPQTGHVRISDGYDAIAYDSYITLYVPTGNQTTEELEDILSIKRFRYESFEVLTNHAPFLNQKLDGEYTFSRYADGFADLTSDQGVEIEDLQNQYAFYTGSKDGVDHYLWYSTLYSGWIFSTGEAFNHDTLYSKYISPPSGDTDNINIADFEYFDSEENNVNFYTFSPVGDGRGLSEFSLKNSFIGLRETRGAISQDININETPQIINIPVVSGVEKDFGSLIQVDTNDESSLLLPLVPKGSIYRLKRKNTTDKIYRILSVREEDTHSYQIVASLFESGKFREIEETNFRQGINYNEPYTNDTQYKIDESTYFKLPEPTNVTWTPIRVVDGGATTATLIGNWNPVTNATGYRVGYRTSFDQSFDFITTPNSNLDVEDIIENGQYVITVEALGPIFNNDDYYTHYLDSDPVRRNVEIDFLEDSTVAESSSVNQIIIN